MHLVDPKYPKHTRYGVYGLFALLLVATLMLGATSILKSVSDAARVSEGAAELTHDVREGLDARFSKTYAEETDPINN